jgi:hypothetical protein
MKKIEILLNALLAVVALTLTTGSIALADSNSGTGSSGSSGSGSGGNTGASSDSGDGTPSTSDNSGSGGTTPAGTTPTGPLTGLTPGSTPPPVIPPKTIPPSATCPDGSTPDASGKCPSSPTTCPNGEKPDPKGNCPTSPPTDCKKNPKDPSCTHTCPDGRVIPKDEQCIILPPHCKLIDNGSKVVCHHSRHGGSSHTTVIKYMGGGYTASGMIMLPSSARDFANNDPKTLTLDFVNPTGPDAIGNYWVKGEVVNNGNTTLQGLKITAHWFDAGNKIIGVTYGYTDKINTDLNPGDRSTFSILADGHNDLVGIPRFVELSYDWQ